MAEPTDMGESSMHTRLRVIIERAILGRTATQGAHAAADAILPLVEEARKDQLPEGAKWFPENGGIEWQGQTYFPVDYLLTRSDVAAIQAEAVTAERERCAQIADDAVLISDNVDKVRGFDHARWMLAAAIRDPRTVAAAVSCISEPEPGPEDYWCPRCDRGAEACLHPIFEPDDTEEER